MRVVLMIFLLHWLSPFSFGQLNCISNNNDKDITTKTCFHKNGEPSTVEAWDKQHREGHLKAYSPLGKELFNYSLRSYSGHSSVYIDYYLNGQVKKAEYSSAPDGGIQFWKIIHEFDENGNQTAYYDLSEPEVHPTLIHISPQDTPLTYIKSKKKQEPVDLSNPYMTVFELTNETKKSVRIFLKAPSNPYIQLKDTIVIIKPKQSLIVDSLKLLNIFFKQHESFLPELLEKNGRKSTLQIIEAPPIEGDHIKTYHWHILRH